MLYKQLNKQRKRGEWKSFGIGKNDYGCHTATIRSYAANDTVSIVANMYSTTSDETATANAAYTCLAVNNLHHLAEALERIIDRIDENNLSDYFPSAYERAKEALTRIS